MRTSSYKIILLFNASNEDHWRKRTAGVSGSLGDGERENVF